jgi:hypothetical protein
MCYLNETVAQGGKNSNCTIATSLASAPAGLFVYERELFCILAIVAFLSGRRALDIGNVNVHRLALDESLTPTKLPMREQGWLG